MQGQLGRGQEEVGRRILNDFCDNCGALGVETVVNVFLVIYSPSGFGRSWQLQYLLPVTNGPQAGGGRSHS